MYKVVTVFNCSALTKKNFYSYVELLLRKLNLYIFYARRVSLNVTEPLEIRWSKPLNMFSIEQVYYHTAIVLLYVKSYYFYTNVLFK